MLSVGVNPLPVDPYKKNPVIKWKEYQSRLMTVEEVDRLFINSQGIACIAGKVSGGLECIDFDIGGLFFDAWESKLLSTDPILHDKLCVTQTQSGGLHVFYRCTESAGNVKLLVVESAYGSSESGDLFIPTPKTAIETRGEGGYFIVPPSPKYTWIYNNWNKLQTITPQERQVLLLCVHSAEIAQKMKEDKLVEYTQTKVIHDKPASTKMTPLESVYEEKLDVKALSKHGWTLVQVVGKHEHWRRPNKTEGTSATRNIDNGIFYCFTSNGHPFEQNQSYSASSVYTLLEFNGDFKAASKNLFSLGIGQYNAIPMEKVKVSKIAEELQERAEAIADLYDTNNRRLPNTDQFLPNDLVSVEGFVNEFKEFTSRFSLWKQPEICFSAGLVFLSFLLGRRVSDEWNNRPILYIDIVGVAGCGKGAVDSAITRAIDDYDSLQPIRVLPQNICRRLASASALNKMLLNRKRLLVLWDEYGDSLKASVRYFQSNQYGLISTWTELFSQANNNHYIPPITALGLENKKNKVNSVSQPHVTFCGLTNPKDYQAALVGDLLSSGYISRRFIVWGRNTHDKSGIESNITTPISILDKMYLWDYTFAPCDETTEVEKINEKEEQKLSVIFPRPLVIPTTESGKQMWTKALDLMTDFFQGYVCPEGFDEIAIRVIEKAHSLALISACSRVENKSDVDTLEITERDIKWAFRYSLYNAVMFFQWSKDAVIDSQVGSASYLNAVLSHKMHDWFKMNVGKRISKTQVAQKFCHYSSKDRQEAMNNLIEQRTLIEKYEGSGRDKYTYYQLSTPPIDLLRNLLNQADQL
jgi:hypothetical protein